VSDFLRSNALKACCKGYTSTIFEREEIEIESEPGSRGQSRFLSVPPEIASAYWLWQAHRGKKAALALCVGLITESLKRRLDEAFGVTLREGGRNELRASSIARDDRSGGTVRRTNSTDSPLIASRVNWNPGDRVKVSAQYPGAFE
jgi:hypothetical protein